MKRNPLLAMAAMMGMTPAHDQPVDSRPIPSAGLKFLNSMSNLGSGPPSMSTSPKDFFTNGKHLSARKLWKRRRKNGFCSSPCKRRRLKARKGFRIGRTR